MCVCKPFPDVFFSEILKMKSMIMKSGIHVGILNAVFLGGNMIKYLYQMKRVNQKWPMFLV